MPASASAPASALSAPAPVPVSSAAASANLEAYLALKLAANGYLLSESDADARSGGSSLLGFASDLLESYREKSRLLADYLCPPDRRIQDFLDRHCADVAPLTGAPRLPGSTLMLDRPGLTRLLSLPAGRDEHHTRWLSSWRVRQGVLHNPRSDRRTTAGSFHIAAGGLPVPGDKKEVPKAVFVRLFHAAMSPPDEDLALPYTAGRAEPARSMLSLLIRPMVRPAVPSTDARLATPAQTMEIRLFAPGGLVSNLDFIEAIFGNAGNPHLPENDAGLDIDHWTGHTGCIVFAPHLVELTKQALGLPRRADATPRQRRDRMCYEREDERYNDGKPFKITCRDASGVMVTLIADNYFGYGKKEVKTQISFAANLGAHAEEEHAGGALAFPSYALGDSWRMNSLIPDNGATFADLVRTCGSGPEALFTVQPEGYGIDRRFPEIRYVPEDASFHLHGQRIEWTCHGRATGIRLRPGERYVLPSGYKVRMERHPNGRSWRLVGTDAEGTFCHKPATVSGGGKSEISKSIGDAILYGPLHVNDLAADFDAVEALLARDYSDRFLPPFRPDYVQRAHKGSRPILSSERSLGSVIKMFTPSPVEFTPAYNAWLKTIPTRILTLLFLVKRFHRSEWGAAWRAHFSVDIVNGSPGHQLKIDGRPLTAAYLRVGVDDDGAWRTYKLRQDFIAADKVQMEDDITASAVVPRDALPALSAQTAGRHAVKLATNCENRLFQRPDDAIHRGQDAQAEHDLAGVGAGPGGVFISNFQPLDGDACRELVDDAIGFAAWTAPMQQLLTSAAAGTPLPDGRKAPSFAVSSAHPRLVEGKPSKNPRYLQERPDRADALGTWLAELGARLHRRLAPGVPVLFAVDAVLPGRRNNPPETGVRPLAVHGPIHHLPLPELFMELASSLTGKSPSTTGAGSEGALTKGPFNALDTIADLDNALVAMLLCGHAVFTTSAGCIGPRIKVGHDISLLIPEIWCRLPAAQRDPAWLIAEGHLEAIRDFDHQGRRVLASRLGYRITERFVHGFFGKIFDNPAAVFDQAMLRPETQDLDVFVDGVDNIVEAQRLCAQQLLDDGAGQTASPPLLAVLDLMATGQHRGRDASHADIRGLFTRDWLLRSDWYRRRLAAQQAHDTRLWQRHVAALERFLGQASHAQVAAKLGIGDRLARARARVQLVSSPAWIERLHGMPGMFPAFS